jgi:hypothetical protein
MYIENLKQKNVQIQRNRKINDFLAPPQKQEEKMLEEPENFFISEHSKDVLAHWQAPEHETFQRDKKWYFYVTLALIVIISWAIYSNSPIMAITFILIGMVGYMHINKEPRVLDFMITPDGIVAGREIFDFDNLKSFWIFYEPEGLRAISLHTKSSLMPYVHIPIHEEDPIHIREILLDHIEEEKHEPGLVEAIGRVLNI